MNSNQLFLNSTIPYILAGIIVSVLVFRIVYNTRSGRSVDGPLMAADGMLTTPGLTAVTKSTIAGFSYILMTNRAGGVMVLVNLGETTDVHLLAYGDKSSFANRVDNPLSLKWLEPVSLEGDFPDYFHMYISPDKQMEVREIFTPDIMALFADFCRAYDLEIFHDSLYIAQNNGADDPNDQTTLMTDIENFLNQNAEVLKRLSRK